MVLGSAHCPSGIHTPLRFVPAFIVFHRPKEPNCQQCGCGSTHPLIFYYLFVHINNSILIELDDDFRLISKRRSTRIVALMFIAKCIELDIIITPPNLNIADAHIFQLFLHMIHIRKHILTYLKIMEPVLNNCRWNFYCSSAISSAAF